MKFIIVFGNHILTNYSFLQSKSHLIPHCYCTENLGKNALIQLLSLSFFKG